jgi:hemin uptake protein HemP
MTHMSIPFDGKRLRPALQQGTTPDAGWETIPVHNAAELTRGGVVAHIRLDAQTYTLRITRQGKLILTK